MTFNEWWDTVDPDALSALMELAKKASERNKPKPEVAPQGNEVDCRACAHFYCGDTIQCVLARMPPLVCINGNAFIHVAPIRLYAAEARKGEVGK